MVSRSKAHLLTGERRAGEWALRRSRLRSGIVDVGGAVDRVGSRLFSFVRALSVLLCVGFKFCPSNRSLFDKMQTLRKPWNEYNRKRTQRARHFCARLRQFGTKMQPSKYGAKVRHSWHSSSTDCLTSAFISSWDTPFLHLQDVAIARQRSATL